MLPQIIILLLGSILSFPMTADRSRSLDTEIASKAVDKEIILHQGDSVISFQMDPRDARAKGDPSDPDYAVYGYKTININLGGISIEEYNRLEFSITPDCPGLRIVNLTVGFENSRAGGEGYNEPEGGHLINLANGIENICHLEIGDKRRDKMRRLTFTVTLRGADFYLKGKSRIHINKITAQRVASTEQVSGWTPQPGHIIYSMSGYTAGGRKTAIIDCSQLKPNDTFALFDVATGQSVLTGKTEIQTTTIGKYGVIDFSACRRSGRYVLSAGGLVTDTFAIAENDRMWDASCSKVLNFIYSMRCGFPIFGIHTLCHPDLYSEHDGEQRSYSGGWHDAGDLSQQTLQTADVMYSLLELYDKKRNMDPDLAARLREEALWGLDFVMRCRYGDGYHASSMGLLIWTDGVLGSHDDINTVRVQNVAFDNYLYAAYEAYAAKILADDSALASYLTQISKEDYVFACEKFKESGFGGWISPYEHTYCTGESQHMATASWAASMLYDLTGDDKYATDAVDYAEYVLDCQCCTPVGREGLSGFFYRTPQKKSVVHFIHQSREQVFMQALDALCRTQPDHPYKSRWQEAMRNYGGYIKAIMKYTAPYGMIPSGIYHKDEHLDTEAFFALHLFPPTDAARRYGEQRKGGEDIGEGYFVKRFPVWFNIYNGNLAVHTSMGKAAAICAVRLKDEALMDIAREQLYWIVGKNPFAQSLIYGEGSRYPELNNFSSGRIMGAIPVGIRSLGDSDEPYWPQFNCACYKEVWVTSAGKWLSLVAETENTI